MPANARARANAATLVSWGDPEAAALRSGAFAARFEQAVANSLNSLEGEALRHDEAFAAYADVAKKVYALGIDFDEEDEEVRVARIERLLASVPTDFDALMDAALDSPAWSAFLARLALHSSSDVPGSTRQAHFVRERMQHRWVAPWEADAGVIAFLLDCSNSEGDVEGDSSASEASEASTMDDDVAADMRAPPMPQACAQTPCTLEDIEGQPSWVPLDADKDAASAKGFTIAMKVIDDEGRLVWQDIDTLPGIKDIDADLYLASTEEDWLP